MAESPAPRTPESSAARRFWDQIEHPRTSVGASIVLACIFGGATLKGWVSGFGGDACFVLCAAFCCIWLKASALAKPKKSAAYCFVGALLLVALVIPPSLLSPPSSTSPQSGAQLHAGRIYADRTPEELVGFYKNRTTIQGDALAKPYIGLWLRVSGPFGDVKSSHYGEPWTRNVSFKYESLQSLQRPYIALYFDDAKWNAQLDSWRMGKTIVIEGQIDTIEAGLISLQHCELVSDSHPIN